MLILMLFYIPEVILPLVRTQLAQSGYHHYVLPHHHYNLHLHLLYGWYLQTQLLLYLPIWSFYLQLRELHFKLCGVFFFLPDKNLQKLFQMISRNFVHRRYILWSKSPAEVSLRLAELTFWAKSKLFRTFGCQICKWQACSIAKTKWDGSVFYKKKGKVKDFPLLYLKEMHLCSHKNKLENCLQHLFLPINLKFEWHLS